MKEHQHSYWGEKSKYWKHDSDRDSYAIGSKHFGRGVRDSSKGESYNPPTRKHEESYRQGYDEGNREGED